MNVHNTKSPSLHIMLDMDNMYNEVNKHSVTDGYQLLTYLSYLTANILQITNNTLHGQFYAHT